MTYDKRFDEIRTSPLLVLDDLGTESATPWAQEKLFQILNNQVTLLTARAELAEGDADDARKLAEGLRELEEGAE